MALFKKLYRFFPVQLLILHIKHHQILVLIWLFLFLIITNSWGKSYGIPYLLLDPEYLGSVDFISFSILGAAFGGFLMTWNITVYILDSYRFPFLATLNRPFAIFCLNNSILPLGFFITYFIIAINFRASREFTNFYEIMMDISGFLSGLFIIIFINTLYFTTTNKNIFGMFGVTIKSPTRITRKMRMRQNMLWEQYRIRDDEFPVDYFMTARLKVRRIRGVEHYEESMILSVLRQNHFNALIIVLMTLATLIALGFLIDYEIFNIPAGASLVLSFGILVSLSGVLSFWVKGWKNAVMILLLVALDLFYRFGGLSYDNRAYGLHYHENPAPYTYENLRSIASPEKMEQDRQNTIAILNKWKAQTGEQKPKMILLNVSGGGLSAAYFSTLAIQKIDSVLDGKLFKHTTLIAGSSGGMFGSSYMRELYLQKQLGGKISLYDKKYSDNIVKDMLNSICFTILVNDLFFPWQKFKLGEYEYRKDRGYAMERQLNANTGYVMNKTLGDYEEYEREAIIPLLIFSPTIINDERKLYISTQPVSYLMRPAIREFDDDHSDLDGVDFLSFFSEHDPLNLQFMSAIRMNATFPYILPNVTMPSDPVIKVMDAGFRDNYGLGTSARFIHSFRDWINENTSGVIVLQIRNFKRERDIPVYHRESIIDRFINPIANLYENIGNMHDYHHDYMMTYIAEMLSVKLDAIYFEYIPAKREEESSMSFHLTTKEKIDIRETLEFPHINRNIKRLKEAMK